MSRGNGNFVQNVFGGIAIFNEPLVAHKHTARAVTTQKPIKDDVLDGDQTKKKESTMRYA